MKIRMLALLMTLALTTAFSALGAPTAADRFLMKRYGKLSYADYTLLDRVVRRLGECNPTCIENAEAMAATVCRWDVDRAKRLLCDCGLEFGFASWKANQMKRDRKFLASIYPVLVGQEEKIRSQEYWNSEFGLFQANSDYVVDDLALNSIMIINYRVLRDFATELGLKDDAARWTERGSALELAYERAFWDPSVQRYAGRDLSTGEFKRDAGIEVFLPLWLGTSTRERALAMYKVDPLELLGASSLKKYSGGLYFAAKGLAYYGDQETADKVRKAALEQADPMEQDVVCLQFLVSMLLDWQLPREMEMPVPFVEAEKNPAWVVRSYWMDGWTSQVSSAKFKKYDWTCPGDGVYDITAEIMGLEDSQCTGHILLNGKEIGQGHTVNQQSLGIVAAEKVSLKAGDKVELELRGTEEQPKKVNLDAFAIRRRDTERKQCLSAPDAEHAMGLRRHQGIPSIAVSQGGRLWATWYGNVNGCETAENFAVLATSADNGKTWKEVLIADPDLTGLKRAFDPEIWVTPDNRLLWTWSERVAGIYAFGLQRWSGCGADPSTDTIYGVYLDADREPDLAKLSEPFVIGKGVMMCKPIVRKDGSWLLPIAHWYANPSACFYESRDGGKTFGYLGGVTVPEKARTYDEHNVVEFADGSMRTWIRTAGHSGIPGMMESVSSDGGKTWTPAAKGAVPQCSSRIFVTKLKSGNLVMVKNGPRDTFTDRERLTAILSRDNGKTWEGGLLLDERKGVSYPDGCQLADGSILAIWDRNRTVDLEICTARFTEAEILAGGQAKREVLSSPEKH